MFQTSNPVIEKITVSDNTTSKRVFMGRVYLRSSSSSQGEDIIATALMSDNIPQTINLFESKFQMSSSEFLSRSKEGKVPDNFETMVWKSLLV